MPYYSAIFLLTRFYGPTKSVYMRCLYLLFFLLFPAVAPAAATPSDQSSSVDSPQKPPCGLTAADGLKQAKLSLSAGGAGSERAALVCLIEAVSNLNDKLPGLQQPAMLHAIDADHPPGSNRP